MSVPFNPMGLRAACHGIARPPVDVSVRFNSRAQPILRLGEHACKCGVQAMDEAAGSARELVGWGWVFRGGPKMASAVDGGM